VGSLKNLFYWHPLGGTSARHTLPDQDQGDKNEHVHWYGSELRQTFMSL